MQFHTEKYLLSALLASLLVTLPAMSQTPPQQNDALFIKFKLPASSLGDALNLYSRQAGITLSYENSLVQGISVPALSGSYSTENALSTLLRGTNLQATTKGNGGWLIQTSDRNLMVLDTIKVQSRSNTKDQVYRESSSVNIINQEDIERFRGTSVGDIFQGTPGVIVSENRNSGGLDINIRGMQGQGRVPIVIDGSRQETTVYRGYSGVSSRSYIDPDLVGSMRIDKGPVMTAEGTGAIGGLVSASTLRAEDIVSPGELSGVRLRASAIGNSSDSPAAGTYAGYYVSRKVYRSNCRFASDCTKKYKMPEQFAPEHGMDRPSLLDFGSFAGSIALAQRFDWGDLVAAYANRKQGNYYAGKHGPIAEISISEPNKLAWFTETSVSLKGASPFRAGELIPNTNLTSESLLLKSSLYMSHDQNLDLSYINYGSRYGEMMPSQIRGFGQARQWLDSEVKNKTYTARYHWQPGQYDWADLRINLWHTDSITQLNTPGIGSVDISNNTQRTDDYQRYGIDISNQMLFYPLGELQLDYGLAGQWENMDTDTPKGNGFYAGSRSGRRDEFSAFTAIHWQPVSQWTLDAGIRYTSFHSKDNNALPLETKDPACKSDGNNGCLPVYYKNHGAGMAPVIALTWEPIKGLQLYVRRAESLRMPSLFESTSGWSVSPALDIPLKPEHAINHEVGINYLQDSLFKNQDKLRLKIAYFQNHVSDYLTRTQPNAWEVKKAGFDFFRLRNIDSLDINGWELNLNYDAGLWFTGLNGTYYNHIKVCNIGSDVRYYCNNWGLAQSYMNNMIPPNWNASATLGVRLLQQRLEIGARGTFMGKRNPVPRYNAPTGFNKPVIWHNYQLFDMYVKYKFNESISVDFNIDNITDRYYLDALSLGLVPAPGRTARLNMTLKF